MWIESERIHCLCILVIMISRSLIVGLYGGLVYPYFAQLASAIKDRRLCKKIRTCINLGSKFVIEAQYPKNGYTRIVA